MMKPDLLKNTREKQAQSAVSKTQRMGFFQQLNILDLRAYGTWPIAVKISCYFLCFLVVGLIGYFFVIQPQIHAVDRAILQQQQLLDEYKEKSSKLRNLKQYQASLLDMEKQFNQQLEQLPKESEIPSLLEEIHHAGLQSGLKIVNIQLENEQQQDSFIELPISIKARGDYHAYARFVSYLAELPHIVTVHDFDMVAESNLTEQSDIPVLLFSLKAKTYRYIRSSEQNKTAAPASLPNSTPTQSKTATTIVTTPTGIDSHPASQQKVPAKADHFSSENQQDVAFEPRPIARSDPFNGFTVGHRLSWSVLELKS